jgi:hypothetical protein
LGAMLAIVRFLGIQSNFSLTHSVNYIHYVKALVTQ